MAWIKANLLMDGNHFETVGFPCSDDEIMRLTEQKEGGHKATVFINNLTDPKGLKSIEGTYAIVKRLLRHSGMVIDNAKPIAQGHLPGNARITAIKTPIVTDEVGIAASIRFLHPQEVDRKRLLTSGMVDEEMLNFLESCVRYGVSLVVAGRTSSGKTTLLNALLESIPNDKRIFGIHGLPIMSP